MIEPIWAQQPEEPDRWYGRFHCYLLLGSGRPLAGNAKRSLLGCVHEEEKPQKAQKALQNCAGCLEGSGGEVAMEGEIR